jgi:hypothetical protein
MTKSEKAQFDSMVRRIAHDIRRKFATLSDKSGTNYVMVPLQDVLSEINTFTNSIKSKK